MDYQRGNGVLTRRRQFASCVPPGTAVPDSNVVILDTWFSDAGSAFLFLLLLQTDARRPPIRIKTEMTIGDRCYAARGAITVQRDRVAFWPVSAFRGATS